MDSRAYIALLDKEVKDYDPLLLVQESRNLIPLGEVNGQEVYAPEAVTILARRSQLKGGKINLLKVFKNKDITIDGVMKWLYDGDTKRWGTKDVDGWEEKEEKVKQEEHREDMRAHEEVADTILFATGRTRKFGFNKTLKKDKNDKYSVAKDKK